MILDLWTKLNEWSEGLKQFMLDHDQSVILYTGLFMAGLLIFAIAFNTINNGTSDITDDGTASYFVTDKSNLENIDTITIKLSSSKTVTATRQTN